jgi:hypothetical protein
MPKVHNKPIKRPRKGSNKKSKRLRSVPWSGAPDYPVHHRTVSGAPPDSVWCTRAPNSELATFVNSGSHSARIYRTVGCSIGLSDATAE